MNVIERMQKKFKEMSETCYSVFSVESLANEIRNSVRDGKATWEQLGFTDDDINERLRQAKIRTARENFEKMLSLHSNYSFCTINNLAKEIRSLVKNDGITWEELDFTDDDINKRLRQAKIRLSA